MINFIHPPLAMIPRGTGAFLGVAIPVAMLVVAASLKFIGKKSWGRSLLGSFLGFLLYPLAIGLLLWAFSSKEFGDLLGWSMVIGLPILIGIGLLFVAWLGNVALLCWFGGKRAGLITGFIIMPLMWTLCFGAGANLLGFFEEKRGSFDPSDAVERGDHGFLSKLPASEQATRVWSLALQYLDPRAAEIALLAGADVNAPLTFVGDVSQTPLQVALEPLTMEALRLEATVLRGRQKEMVDLLLKHGAEVNLAGPRDEDPLGVAILKTRDPQLVKTLMEAGAKLSSTKPPLHSACLLTPPEGTEIVTLLLDAGADVNVPRPSDHRTPLQCAAVSGNAATIHLLLKRGAKIRPAPLAGPDEAPILLAVLNGRPDNAMVLLENGADPMARTAEGLSAWQLTRDPALRKALEAKGLPREVQFGDFVSADGDFAKLLMKEFSRNTSIYPVRDVFASKLQGVGPWDVRLQFPEDSGPVKLTGVESIECQSLGADSAGKHQNVQNTVFLGDEKPRKELRSRRIERLEAFSEQARLGYAVIFYFEKQEPENVEVEKGWFPKSK